MGKKVFLETDEYDIFMFPVPESVLKGNRFLITFFPRKRVKEWVLSWMQRLHPCFDGRFMHDIKFFKEKGCVMALVTVADKMQVASHLAKKNTAVYVYRPDKRRVFSGNVSSRRLWLASVFAFVLVMVSLSGFAFYSDSRIAMTDTLQRQSFDEVHDLSDFSDVLQESEISDLVAMEVDSFQDVNTPLLAESCDLNELPSEDVEPECNTVEETSYPDVPKNDIEFFADMGTTPLLEATPPEIETSPLEIMQFADAQLTNAAEIQFPDEEELIDDVEQKSDFCESHNDAEKQSIYDTPKIDSFLSLLIESGCRISSFRWQTEPSVSAVIFVEGCFPEDIYACVVELCGDFDAVENGCLPQLLFSPINYSDNVPSFSVILDYSCFEQMPAARHFDEINTSVSADNIEKSIFPVQSVFRKLIVKTGGNVISESMVPPFVSGSIPYGSWNEFSEEVSRIFEAEEASGLSSVAFCADYLGRNPDDVSAGESSVSVSMSFDSNQTSFFPLEKVSVLFPNHGNAPEFSEPVLSEQPLLSELGLTPEPEFDSAKPDMVSVNLEEIGHICMGDNMYMSFYRNEDGTIVKGEIYEKQ